MDGKMDDKRIVFMKVKLTILDGIKTLESENRPTKSLNLYKMIYSMNFN